MCSFAVRDRGSGKGKDMETFYSDHERLDERSLALHRLVAQKILADPALLDKAGENMRRWQEANGSLSPPLAEWEQILSSPVNQVVAFLVERSERATRLRQSSPFAGILTEDERRAVFESFRPARYIEKMRFLTRARSGGEDRRRDDRDLSEIMP
jgi:hypothetical protein